MERLIYSVFSIQNNYREIKTVKEHNLLQSVVHIGSLSYVITEFIQSVQNLDIVSIALYCMVGAAITSIKASSEVF